MHFMPVAEGQRHPRPTHGPFLLIFLPFRGFAFEFQNALKSYDELGLACRRVVLFLLVVGWLCLLHASAVVAAPMGDAACGVAQGFYEPQEAANAEEEEIAIPRLEGSISFGRYMSESLEWGKWSSFRQNRHIEEAERCSKPGSVAQKKAYFEAHYKRIRAQKAEAAAALLEQVNAATNCSPVEETSDVGNHTCGNTDLDYTELQLAQSPVEAVANVAIQIVQELDSDVSVPIHLPNSSCSNERDSGESKIEQEDHGVENQTIMEFPSRILSSPPNNTSSEKETHDSVKSEEKYIEVENQTHGEAPSSRAMPTEAIGNVENQTAMSEAESSRTSHPVKPPLQESSVTNQEISASKLKIQKVLAPKWPIFCRTSTASPSPVKPTMPSHPRKENVYVLNKKSSRDMNDKKISVPKSLHMSINLSTQKANETTPLTTESTPIGDSKLVIIGSSLLSKASPRTPPCESPLITSSRVSAGGIPKAVSLTPQSDTKSTRRASQKTDPKTRKINAMCQSVSTNCWKSSSGSGKRPPQIVCSPFSFRCDERAERRKEFFLKLEEKLNAEKLQRQAKDKEMAENELKRLRQSLGFKARPMPDFYRKTELPKNEIKKIPPMHGQAPRPRRRVNPLEVPVASCFLSLRSSARKTECTNAPEKSGRKLIDSCLVPEKKRPDNRHSTKS